MKARNELGPDVLLKELQLLEDLEIVSQHDGRKYSFRIDCDGMIRDHVRYPELAKVFPAPVPAVDLHEHFNMFSPDLVQYFDHCGVDLPGIAVIDWSQTTDQES